MALCVTVDSHFYLIGYNFAKLSETFDGCGKNASLTPRADCPSLPNRLCAQEGCES